MTTLSERMRAVSEAAFDSHWFTLGGVMAEHAKEVAALEADLSASRAEVARLREALPKPRKPPKRVMRSGGEWVVAAYWTTRDWDWCQYANTWEALTGLDAVTGEKR